MLRTGKFRKAPTEHLGVWFGLVCYCSKEEILDGKIPFVFREIRDQVRRWIKEEGMTVLDQPSLLWHFKGDYLVVRLKP